MQFRLFSASFISDHSLKNDDCVTFSNLLQKVFCALQTRPLLHNNLGNKERGFVTSSLAHALLF